jgi:hypothetical protein
LLREFVTNAAGFDQTVPEMALFAALTSVSFATGGTALVDLNGHHVPLSLWAILTADPSERKSGALTTSARSPLAEAVDWYWESYAAEQERLGHLIDVEEVRIKQLKSALAGVNPSDKVRDDLDRAITALADLRAKVVTRPVSNVTDATTEGLELMMAETGGAVASFADESALLSSISGRYSKNGGISLGSLNQAWSRGAIHVKRQGSTRQVDTPHLVLCQFVQPEPFAKLMGQLRVEADGFLSRWLYADPAPYGPRKPLGAPLDADVRNRWVKTLRSLLDRFWGQRGDALLQLSSEAWAQYCTVFEEIDADQRAYATTNGTFAQWLGKGPNDHVLRVAALFELISDPGAIRISGDSVTRAVTLFRWLRGEALKAMTATSGDTLRPEVEREVLAWIATRRGSDRGTGREPMEFVQARDLLRGPRRFRQMPKEEIEAVLMQLEDQVWLRRTDSAGRSDAQTRWQVRLDFEAVWTS